MVESSIFRLFAMCLAMPQAMAFGVVDEDSDHSSCVLKRVVIAHAFEISTFLLFIAPMFLITVLYMLIGFQLRRSSGKCFKYMVRFI